MTLETLLRPAPSAVRLPRTDHLPPLDTRVLQLAQPVAMAGLRRWYDIRIHDRVHIPRRGRVIIAANHLGTLDGPLVVFATGRPTYALAKNELFDSPVGRLLETGGQIPLHRGVPDPHALRRAIHVLRSEQALAIFPEGVRDAGDFRLFHAGVAYLALVTGAPVVPCAIFGTRLPGAGRKENPPRGSRIDIVYGRPISIPSTPWPRRRAHVADVSRFLRERLAAHLRASQQWNGMALPGPIDA